MFKNLGDSHYYMITDSIDLSIDENDLDADYEIVLIYPIKENPEIEKTIHDELTSVAKFNSIDYEILMEYIIRERRSRGMSDIPKNIEYIVRESRIGKKLDFQNMNLPTIKITPTKIQIHPYKYIKPVKQKYKKFGAKEINEILNDTSTEARIEILKSEMDKILDALSEAMEKKDEKNIELHKNKLEEIRKELMELEYFTL
mgnify:CR=1 FL=1